MNSYAEKQFTFGKLKGLSVKQLEEHLKLYAGYVKHVNVILEQLGELENDFEKNAYLISELRRRFSFEFDGMRMHEYYFEELEGEARAIDNSSELIQVINSQYGSYDNWLSQFKSVSLTRGIGWSILYFDKRADTLINAWVSDHELGVLAGLDIIVAMDMWEHAFMVDYLPSEKKNYIEAFFANLNWDIIEQRFGALKNSNSA
jgi:Fe-Mn family superoxide dismutase